MTDRFSYDFDKWFTLNDTIMGGSSKASCSTTAEGLSVDGILVEEKGGFISCKSPVFSPLIDLSNYEGFQLKIIGKGRTLKFGVSCKSGFFGVTENILNRSPGGLRWVAEIETKKFGSTTVKIPFEELEPTILAKKVSLPVRFTPARISQFQLLHSKFGRPGQLNPGFKAGKINFILQSISAYS